jgi:hypothetical protein
VSAYQTVLEAAVVGETLADAISAHEALEQIAL